MRKKIIGGLLIGGGVIGLFFIARGAKAAETKAREEQLEADIQAQISRCPPGDRDCVMRIRYAAMGRDWDYESSPEYRAAVRERAAAEEEERIRQMRAERWSHL